MQASTSLFVSYPLFHPPTATLTLGEGGAPLARGPSSRPLRDSDQSRTRNSVETSVVDMMVAVWLMALSS
jgi:hypothetical protein